MICNSDAAEYARQNGKIEPVLTHILSNGKKLSFKPTGDLSIAFWEKNESKMPTLSKMALIILRAPSSSSDLERAFGKVKQIFTEKRSSLKSKTTALKSYKVS